MVKLWDQPTDTDTKEEATAMPDEALNPTPTPEENFAVPDPSADVQVASAGDTDIVTLSALESEPEPDPAQTAVSPVQETAQDTVDTSGATANVPSGKSLSEDLATYTELFKKAEDLRANVLAKLRDEVAIFQELFDAHDARTSSAQALKAEKLGS